MVHVDADAARLHPPASSSASAKSASRTWRASTPASATRWTACFVCGTDFGTQTSAFCSVATFRELWFPYYKRVNDWVHANTTWKCFKHSCGSVERFFESFIEAGFDIINPVQCSAAGMDPAELKRKYGSRLVFWGGGVDTQKTLPFGTPQAGA